MDWRHSEILKLIRSYQQYECLWNCHSPDYKQQEMRRTSWIALGKEFKKDVEEIKKKIKHLRNYYLVEKKKFDRLNKNGDSIYEPNLFYFNQMEFLDPVIILRGQDSREDPLSDRKSRPSLKQGLRIAPKRPRLESIEISLDESQAESTASEKSRFDSIDSTQRASSRFDSKPARRRFNDVPKETHRIMEFRQPLQSKEYTFCAMLYSELMQLKSEETYDNVTSEIFTAVKNAKIAERRQEYHLDDDSRLSDRSL